MNTVVLLWGAVGGTAFALAGAHILLWFLDRRAWGNLIFAVIAVSFACISVAELGMMQSATPAEYGAWVRWFHVPNFFMIAGIIIFVQLQFGTGRVWLGTTIIAIRAIQLGLNFVLEPNLNWKEISSLRTITFLGEPVSVVGRSVPQDIQPIATLALVLLLIYIADALRRALRRDDREFRRKAITICGAMLAFIVVSSAIGQLIVYGIVQMPVIISLPFIIVMLAVTYELSRNAVGSARALREAERLRHELAHVARVSAISQLAASLAHEISQPLTAISFNADSAQMMMETEKPDLAELGAILEAIRTDVRRVTIVIDHTREFVRNQNVERDAVSIPALAKEVFALVRNDAIKRRINLVAALPNDIPPVRGDRVQLSQVLLNLIMNGFDAMSSGSQHERRLRVEARSAQKQVEVAVTDSGTGVDPDLLPRVFDSFVTTKTDGLGIGLSVARDIVTRHGGRIWAENNASGGATFRFTLPLA
jgi:signal transduction histidine kinase